MIRVGVSLGKIELRASAVGSRMRVRTKPAARRTAIEGEHGGALRVAVTAAPERGRANEAVERVLASALGLPSSAVQVVAGHTSRDKIVEIATLAPEEVRRRLSLC